MKLHHIGYLVKDMDKAIGEFALLGYSIVSESVYDKYRKIYICFMENNGTVVELIQSGGEDSTVAGLYKKYGNSPYHICYEVDDLENAISELRKKCYVITAKPCEAPALESRRVAFLYNAQIGMIELLEETKHD